ncbi:MAG: hypothetical protein ABSA17_07290 [Rhabdochlamydiaceae bacterium]
MAFVAKLQSNLSVFYNMASGYSSLGYNWVKSSGIHVYSKMPAVSPAIKNRVFNVFNKETILPLPVVEIDGSFPIYIQKNQEGSR